MSAADPPRPPPFAAPRHGGGRGEPSASPGGSGEPAGGHDPPDDLQDGRTPGGQAAHDRAAGTFALPPPTTGRLRLLFLTVAAGSYFAGYLFLVWGQDGWRAANEQCAAARADLVACTSRVLILQSLTPMAGLLLIAALTVLGYLSAPVVVTWWQKADRLGDWPEELRETVDAAGLPAVPEPVRRRRDNEWTMFVYGRRPRHRVLLPANLRLSLLKGPAEVRALLAHELGHLQNRDVDRSILALFATGSFLLVMAVAVAASAAMRIDPPIRLALGWRLVLLVSLVVATFAGVLRAREHDADLRASTKHRATLLELLKTSAAQRSWPIRLHPTLPDRRRIVLDPGLTMRTSVPEAFATGVAGGVAILELAAPVQALLPEPELVAYWIAAFVVALPIAGVVGLAVWRSVLHDVEAGVRRTRVVLPGVALGTGVVLGSILAPRGSAPWTVVFTSVPESTAQLTFLEGDPLTAICLAAGLPLVTALVLNWVALAAAARLPGGGPRAWRPMALATAVVFGGVFGTWFLAARFAAVDQWRPASLAGLVIEPWEAGVLAAVALTCCAVLLPLRRAPWSWFAGAAGGLLLSLVFLGAVATGAVGARPVAQWSAAALPESNEPEAVCLWLRAVGIRALGDRGDHDTRARLGDFLRTAPDSHLRRAGGLMSLSARTRSHATAMDAWRLLVRRCDLIKRYPETVETPPATPTPPFPLLTE
ncbi:M48 family metalloprotease [Sphaerisporangium sp. NPDC004334]